MARFFLGIVLGVALACGATAYAQQSRHAAGRHAGRGITLAIGDQITMPAIGWTCDYQIASHITSLTCSPGVVGTSSQGLPLDSIQRTRVVMFTGPNGKPTVTKLPASGGIYQFATTR